MTIYEQLQALLNPFVANKCWALTARQGAQPPYIVYEPIGGTPNNTLEGNGTPSIKNLRLHIYCFGSTFPNAATLKQLVIDAMAGWIVQNVLLIEEPGFDAQTENYWLRLEYSIWHY